MTTREVPPERVYACNPGSVNGAGEYILYWMIASRRRNWNFALQRAVHWAEELRKPLLVLEALSCTYPWASSRFHTALMQGMRDNLQSFEHSGATYYPFIERFPSHGEGLMHTLAESACVVVTDDFPAFEIPRWITAVAVRSRVLVEKVDSNGIFPMRSTDRLFTSAYSFRRFLQAVLRRHLEQFPLPDSLADVELPEGVCPPQIQRRWPAATLMELSSPHAQTATIPVDQSVPTVSSFAAGARAACGRLKTFMERGLPAYIESRTQPEADTSSGLSPYLHFGHISAHQIFRAVTSRSNWTPEKLRGKPTGGREGWWGVPLDTEAFLDQLITWREIGFNMCAHSTNYASYDSLPAWARKTLSEHAADLRPKLYSPGELENARTHDPLWNAAQLQLVQEGRVHNYLRMLWGKKILEWSRSPQDALEIMIHLNNKYALDGRDPNSYSGIFWTLGRYDRPWAPERPIFGKIRYMSSGNTARKMRVRGYVQRYTKE
ncbi:MAG TPA: deoxyribodipyrimidine photolyase [Terriglobia bacterium]|jgi:deoxyribodipyrimidine photo-lyase